MADKDAYYFSHDSNALTDPKILSMRCDYGFESYGLYWAIIEMLRNESTYKLPLDRNTYRAIKMQTATTIDIEKFINDCINEYKDNESGNGLFNTDGKSFWSESLLRRMEKYETLKEKRSQAGKKAMQNRWGKEKQNNNKARTKNRKKIKGITKNNKVITMLSKNNNKVITSVVKKHSKLITKNNKLNQIKLKEIKLNKMKSIYQSDHDAEKNNFLDGMMDKTEKVEFEKIVEQSQVKLYDFKLANEIIEIMKEIYMNPQTREKMLKLNIYNIDYALKNFSIENTKQKIHKPKAYFKQCLLSALEQTELSKQFDTETINEIGDG